MAKKNRNGSGRADKLRRRAARAGKQHARHQQVQRPDSLAHLGPVPSGLDLTGWHVMGPGNDIDDIDDIDEFVDVVELEDMDFARPDEALFDASGCPVAATCAGCGGVTGLHPVVAAFTRPAGNNTAYDTGCVTLCHDCDGRSFLHLLDQAALEAAFRRHATHARPAPIAVTKTASWSREQR